jgi:hypothetical protein
MGLVLGLHIKISKKRGLHQPAPKSAPSGYVITWEAGQSARRHAWASLQALLLALPPSAGTGSLLVCRLNESFV